MNEQKSSVAASHLASQSDIMEGKRGLIMGLANDKSIAWGIAKACADAGAEMAFTYMGDAFRKRVAPLADQLGVQTLIDCDVSDPASIDAASPHVSTVCAEDPSVPARRRRGPAAGRRSARTRGGCRDDASICAGPSERVGATRCQRQCGPPPR